MNIRVGICDDQALIRDGLRMQLGLAADVEVVGEAADGEQAIALARRELPDVLLMDIRMPRLDGIEATRRIAADPATSGVRTLILTTFDLDEHVTARWRPAPVGSSSKTRARRRSSRRSASSPRGNRYWLRPSPRD